MIVFCFPSCVCLVQIPFTITYYDLPEVLYLGVCLGENICVLSGFKIVPGLLVFVEYDLTQTSNICPEQNWTLSSL